MRGGHEPGFADLVRQRQATLSATENGDRLFMTLALLQAKPALDRELSGAVLQQLAKAVGEDVLDAIREIDQPNLSADILVSTLPPVSALAARGRGLLATIDEDPQIASLAQCADEILRDLQPRDAAPAS
ncbi:MAG: hypothetical protein WBA51_12700 [Erythrobacter sp.]